MRRNTINNFEGKCTTIRIFACKEILCRHEVLVNQEKLGRLWVIIMMIPAVKAMCTEC